MSHRPPDEDHTSRWRREAGEELRAAEVVAAHDEIPDRVAGVHAHLAAEKALKSLLIELGIEVPRDPRSHRAPPAAAGDGAGCYDPADLEVLNPWTIEGRYPADLPDVDDAFLDETLVAARRVIDALVGEAG